MVEFQDENNYSPPTNSNLHCKEDTTAETTSTVFDDAFNGEHSKRLDTPKRRAKSYPPPLTASLLKKSKLKLYAPPQKLVLTSDEEDDEVSATAATNRLLVIYGKTLQPSGNNWRVSKAEKEKLTNTANPVPSTSVALCREMRRIGAVNGKPLKSIRPSPSRAEVKDKPKSPSSSKSPKFPSSSRVRPSRGSKRSAVNSKVIPKKREPKLRRQKRKVKAKEENEEDVEALPVTKKFRGDVITHQPETTVVKDFPTLSPEDIPDLVKPEPFTGAKVTDDENQDESKPGGYAQNGTTEGAEEETQTTIKQQPNESTTSIEPTQSGSEVINEKGRKGIRVRKRATQFEQQRRPAKRSPGTDGEETQGGTVPVRKSGRVRQAPRGKEDYWLFVHKTPLTSIPRTL